jgi:sulfate permease, SulP family
VLCLLGWVARAGALADLLSKPVLIGYLAGIAVTMIVSQLGKLTGVPVEGNSVPAEIGSWLIGLGRVHTPTVVLSVLLLVMLLIGGRLWPNSPMPLIGMLAATAVVATFSLQHHGIVVLGQTAIGIPAWGVPHLSAADLSALALPALGVAVVAYSDNVLTARAFAARRSQTVNASTELIALGTANLAVGFLRGFPVSSSGSRTAIGDAQGSRTQLHSLVVVVLVALVLSVGRTVLASFPVAALGAIVIYAALRLIDLPEFVRIARFRRAELVLAFLTTTAAVLAFGVLYGVLAAVGLSIMELLRRLARPHDGILGYVPEVADMHDVDDYPNARQVPGLMVYRYDAPLCFANAEDFRRRALAAAAAAPSTLRWFLLNAEANVEMDSTAADALAALQAQLKRQQVVFALARVKQDLRGQLVRAGLIDAIGEDQIFMTLPTAVAAYRHWHEQRFGPLPDNSITGPTNSA